MPQAETEDRVLTGGEATATRGRVLVIEDERLVRELAAETLAAEGFTVETSDNGRAGVEHYRSHWQEIDLVILDLVMPEMHGAEAFGWLRRINPAARVLVASGYTSEGEVQSLVARGAVAFIQKPFDRALLLRRVSEALAAPLEPASPKS